MLYSMTDSRKAALLLMYAIIGAKDATCKVCLVRIGLIAEATCKDPRTHLVFSNASLVSNRQILQHSIRSLVILGRLCCGTSSILGFPPVFLVCLVRFTAVVLILGLPARELLLARRALHTHFSCSLPPPPSSPPSSSSS